MAGYLSSEQQSRPRWLRVEQIRKQRRMRRKTVIATMLCGELPYEQRGRIRYVRVSDVEAWEERRLDNPRPSAAVEVHPSLLEFL
jgi:hypothetical protein